MTFITPPVASVKTKSKKLSNISFETHAYGNLMTFFFFKPDLNGNNYGVRSRFVRILNMRTFNRAI